MKIYSNYPFNLFLQSALVSAELAGQNVEVVYVSQEEAKTKEWLAKSPTGKFPLLELDSGEFIFESGAIAAHFARNGAGAYGVNHFHTAKCDEWIAFS